MKFEEKQLGEIAEITKLAGFEFTKYFEYQEYGEIIAIRGLNVKDGFLDLRNVKYINRVVSENLVRSKLFYNDIVLTYTGSKYGDVALIEENNKYHLAPNVAKVSISDGNDPYFYFMVFQSPKFKSYLKNFGVGSGQPTIPMKSIRTIPVPVPPIEIQNKISTILNKINAKIELNNRMINTLEELIATLFKQWFIEFEFPNENGKSYKSNGGKMIESELGEIPNGWKVKSLPQVADYKNGLAMQKFRPEEGEDSLPVLKIKELNQGFTDLSSDRCASSIKEEVKVFDGDVIFSWSGTLLVKLWTGDTAGLNQHLFKVTSDEFEKWFYYLWTKHYLIQFISIAKDKATTMGHIKRENLSNSKVCYPTDSATKKIFSATFSPLIDQIIELGIENRYLKESRDTLLPKLLSGELEV